MTMRRSRLLFQIIACAFFLGAFARAETIQIDAAVNRKTITPLIYGVNFATAAQLADLNVPLNRSGGNITSRYNWQINAANHDIDFYFESIGYDDPTPAAEIDAHISASIAGGAQPMVTIPMMNYIATLGPDRGKLASFSQQKYGAQTDSDTLYFPDAGNGILKNPAGKFVTNNDPLDAHIPNSAAFQTAFMQRTVAKFGTAGNGGVKYYLLDNEPGIWFETHRDVEPVGLSVDDLYNRMAVYSPAIRAVDPNAMICGPEEWGVLGYIFSGKDKQQSEIDGTTPDYTAHGGTFAIPYLLQRLRAHEVATGEKLIDVLTVHDYPQGNEFSDDVSTATQLLRNRSTRSLWDPNYTDESYLKDLPLPQVHLVSTLRNWVNMYYPGLPIGVTEYSWGADGAINGATAQADIFGIFGREGLDLATRYTVPDTGTPAYNAIKMYRNYDGQNSTFGDMSVQATVTDPDTVAAFAAVRGLDGALTIMVVNKQLGASAPVTLSLANFASTGAVGVWQLDAGNTIQQLADLAVVDGTISTTVPQQSITLFVVASSSTVTVNIDSPTSHAGFDAPGSFAITASAQANGGTISQVEFFQDGNSIGVVTQTPYSVSVAALPVGLYTFQAKATSDTNETALSAQIEIVVSDPSGAVVPPLDLTIKRLSVKVDFKHASHDSLLLQGVLPINSLSDVAGAPISFDIGGIQRQLTPNARGKAASGADTLTIAKPRNGNAGFTLKLNKGTFFDSLMDEGFANAAVKKLSTPILVKVSFNGQTYQHLQPQTYSATKGRNGASK